METITMKVADIRPAKYNPRITLKPGDQAYEALKNSLERFGLAEPLIVNKTTGNLVSGHQRLNVLKATGATEAEVVIVELDEDEEKLLNIALNKIEGEWDFKKLEAMFEDISGEDIKFTGFTEKELSDLFWTEDPDFEKDEDSPEEDTEEKKEDQEEQEAQKEFNVFISFATKELAESWLEERGVEKTFEGTSRNITIRMDGLNYYGTGN